MTRRLTEIHVTHTERWATGPWDLATGGLPVGASILLSGTPGAGKTTLLIQWCDAVVSVTGRPVLYVSSEQTAESLYERTLPMRLAHPDQIHVLSLVQTPADPVATFEDLAPALIVLDSISEMFGTDGETATLYLRAFRKLLTKHRSVGVFVSHVNKDDQITGQMAIQHQVDLTAILARYGDISPCREFFTAKNRYGAESKVCLRLESPGFARCPGCEDCESDPTD